MSKVSVKNATVLIGGYKLSTYATAFETQTGTNPIDVTGFGDAAKNFIPGLNSAVILSDMMWSSTAAAVHTALHDFGEGHVTILPEGYTQGATSISLPYTQANYTPKGTPDSSILVSTINFVSYGDNEGVEYGKVLYSGSITDTTTSAAYQFNASQATARCSATLHIWTACAADRYEVKIQDCSTAGGAYSDLITFTADGSAVTSERQTVASGTIDKFMKVVATRTGSAGNPFGFTVHYCQY